MDTMRPAAGSSRPPLQQASSRPGARSHAGPEPARPPPGRPFTAQPSRRGLAQTGAAQQDSLFSADDPTATRRRLFNSIAPVYDELNDRLSLGQHRVWKRMAVKWAAARAGSCCLDVCCGSGDLALLLAEAAGPSGRVTALDFAADMLEYAEGRRREQRRPGSPPAAEVEWVLGDATELPFADASFDAATMGYGLRNVASIPAALRELRRVLRPGGSAAILDFNNASQSNPLADAAQAWALENVVVPAAAAYGLEEEYRYLRPSIQAFPTGREQEALAWQAGFAKAVHYEVGFGLMGVLVATV